MSTNHTTVIEYVQPNSMTNTRTFEVTPEAEPHQFVVRTTAEKVNDTQSIGAGEGIKNIGGVGVEVLMGEANQATLCVVRPVADLGGRGGGRNLVRSDLIIGFHTWQK